MNKRKRLETEITRNLRSRKENTVEDELGLVLGVKDLVQLTSSYLYEFKYSMVFPPIRLQNTVRTVEQVYYDANQLAVSVIRVGGMREILDIDLKTPKQHKVRLHTPNPLHIHLDGSLWVYAAQKLLKIADGPNLPDGRIYDVPSDDMMYMMCRMVSIDDTHPAGSRICQGPRTVFRGHSSKAPHVRHVHTVEIDQLAFEKEWIRGRENRPQ